MKIPLPILTIRNFWDYYFLKMGLISKATLWLKSCPDCLGLEFDRHHQKQARRTLKDLLKLIRMGEFEYVRADHSMVIYSSGKATPHRVTFNFARIETIRYFLEHAIPFQDSDEEPFYKVSLGGFSFFIRKEIPGDAFVLGETFMRGEYEFLRPYMSGALVLDIGAYVGDTACLFTHYGARKIVAFEPHPELYRLAQKNIVLNHLPASIDLRNEGVAATDKTITLREDGDAGASAAFGLYESVRGKEIELHLVSIKKILQELGSVDVLKMDCEGAEFEIFEALSLAEIQSIKAMGLEYHRDPKPIVEKLKQAGFKVTLKPDPESEQGLLFAIPE